MLHSTLGRHGARAVRTAVLSEHALQQWQLLTDNILKGDAKIYNPPQFPKGQIEGVGFHEAPRGALSHWVVVDNGKIKNYQAVVPTTWNASPRDKDGKIGPYEAALLKNPVAQPERAHDPLVRPLHGVRSPYVRCGGKERRSRKGPVMRIGVYGISNVLAHDDAVGPSVVRRVDAAWQFDGDVTVEALGTPAIELPTHLAGFDAVVLVDAVSATLHSGTTRIYDRGELL